MKNKLSKYIAFLLVAFMLISGCTIKIVPNPPKKPPLKVAVLPMENLSNDVNGPVIVRNSFNNAITRTGYITMDLEYMDNVLREIGITDGGQLRAYDNKYISEKLGVDVLIFGEVVQYFQGTTFELIPLGLCYKREVRARFKMINVATGKLMWQKEYGISRVDPLGQEKPGEKKSEKTKTTYKPKEPIKENKDWLDNWKNENKDDSKGKEQDKNKEQDKGKEGKKQDKGKEKETSNKQGTGKDTEKGKQKPKFNKAPVTDNTAVTTNKTVEYKTAATKGNENQKTEHTIIGDLIGNVLSDTIKSGVEIISDEVADRLANTMPPPYYY